MADAAVGAQGRLEQDRGFFGDLFSRDSIGQAVGAGIMNSVVPGLGLLGVGANLAFGPGPSGGPPPVFGGNFDNRANIATGGGGGGLSLPPGLPPALMGEIAARIGEPGLLQGINQAVATARPGTEHLAASNFLHDFVPGSFSAPTVGPTSTAPVTDDFDQRLAEAIGGARDRFGQRTRDLGLGSLLSPPPTATTAPVGQPTGLDGDVLTPLADTTVAPQPTALEQRFTREAEQLGGTIPRTTTDIGAFFDPG